MFAGNCAIQPKMKARTVGWWNSSNQETGSCTYFSFLSFFLSFFFFFFFFCEIYGCYECYKFGDQLPSRICFSYNFIQVKSSLLFTSCGTALKLASMHCSLTSISFQLYVILTGNIIQIYNFGCCGYYLEETTDRKYVDAY